jgi:diphthine synthase
MNRGRLIYEPPRYMSPYTAFKQILLTESQRHPTPEKAAALAKQAADDDEPAPPATTPSLLPPSKTLALSLSRIGTPTQRIISGTLEELASLPEEEFGDPLHSVVIVGKRLHPLELEFAGRWCVGGENGDWWKVGKEVYGVERESL